MSRRGLADENLAVTWHEKGDPRRRLLDRMSHHDLVVTTVVDFVRPDELVEAQEAVESCGEDGEENEIVMVRGLRRIYTLEFGEIRAR